MMRFSKKNIAVFCTFFILMIFIFVVLLNNHYLETWKKRNLCNMHDPLYYALVQYSGYYSVFPPDLGVLMDNEYLTDPNVFASGHSGINKPKSGDDVRNGCCDYIYLGKGYQLKLKSKGPQVMRDGICHGWRNELISNNVPLLVMKPGIYKTHLVLFADGTTSEFKKLPVGISKKIENYNKKNPSNSPAVGSDN